MYISKYSVHIETYKHVLYKCGTQTSGLLEPTESLAPSLFALVGAKLPQQWGPSPISGVGEQEWSTSSFNIYIYIYTLEVQRLYFDRLK